MQKSDRGKNVACMLPIVGGVVCGILLLHFFGEEVWKDTLFFGSTLFEEFNYMQYKKGVYLFYLLKIRGLQVGFVVLMSYLHKKELGAFIWAWITGIGFGIGLYAMIQQWGYIGLIGYVMMLFPHYLCYLFSYYQYLKIDQRSQNQKAKSYIRGGKTGNRLTILGVVIIGIILECYVNPFFLKFFSKIFL